MSGDDQCINHYLPGCFHKDSTSVPKGCVFHFSKALDKVKYIKFEYEKVLTYPHVMGPTTCRRVPTITGCLSEVRNI